MGAPLLIKLLGTFGCGELGDLREVRERVEGEKAGATESVVWREDTLRTMGTHEAARVSVPAGLQAMGHVVMDPDA